MAACETPGCRRESWVIGMLCSVCLDHMRLHDCIAEFDRIVTSEFADLVKLYGHESAAQTTLGRQLAHIAGVIEDIRADIAEAEQVQCASDIATGMFADMTDDAIAVMHANKAQELR